MKHIHSTKSFDRLASLGYERLSDFSLAHMMLSLPIFKLGLVSYIRPHYSAVLRIMEAILRKYKEQPGLVPLPNPEHLALADHILHAPRTWWRSLDAHRAHIMTCVEAVRELNPVGVHMGPVGRSSTFQQASGVMPPRQHPNPGSITIQPNPMVARNKVYAMHQIQQQQIAKPAAMPMIPSPGNPVPMPTVSVPQAHQVLSFPIHPETDSYETPLFTWLLRFTSPTTTRRSNSDGASF